MRAVGYARVSTEEQGQSGLGLDDQETKVVAEIKHRGWDLLEPLFVDVASGKSMKKRPSLAKALAALDAGDADVLVVSKLDRLARSVSDFTTILARANSRGWALVVVELQVDTSSPHGKMLATVLMALAEWERDMIGERTKNALGAAKRAGTQLGRPTNVSTDTVAMIRRMRTAGKSFGAIAKLLNEAAVPTAQGGKRWYPATVRNVWERDTDHADVDEPALVSP